MKLLSRIEYFIDNQIFATYEAGEEYLEELFVRSIKCFAKLNIFHRGCSKEIRHTEVAGVLIQKFLPTVYSYRINRIGEVAGTDRVRMRISKVFWKYLHENGIKTCVLAAGDDYALILEERVPPVEVIVKASLVGTPTHIYDGLFDMRDRHGEPFMKGVAHAPYVRFDYRNPLTNTKGERLRDEQLPIFLAERLIDTSAAEQTALKVFEIVNSLCHRAGFEVLDFCLFLNERGDVLCGEISPDNMRIKCISKQEDYDKDIWRKDGSPEELLTRWTTFAEALENVCETS